MATAWWAYEDDAVILAGAGEVGILRQEAIAWMYGLSSCLPCRLDDVVYLQIALRRRRRADKYCFVCVFGEQGVLVRLGVDGYG